MKSLRRATHPRRAPRAPRALSIIEMLIVIAIIAVIAGLTFSALRRGREAAENLKIAQVVRGGVNRCAELKVQRLQHNYFLARWKGDQNESRAALLRQDSNGEFILVGAPPPLP